METVYSKNVTGYQEAINTGKNNLGLVKSILSVIYIAIPVVAGVDKFLNILTDWTKYLNPLVHNLLGITPGLFMSIVGIIEIAAGIIVYLDRRTGAYIVSIWLLGIALQLIAAGLYLDVAVRDIVMAAGALSLGLLSEKN